MNQLLYIMKMGNKLLLWKIHVMYNYRLLKTLLNICNTNRYVTAILSVQRQSIGLWIAFSERCNTLIPQSFFLLENLAHSDSICV